MSASFNEIYGRGVRIIVEDRKVELLFEVQDLAQDETGKRTPAGVKFGFELKADAPLQALDEMEKLVRKIEANGYPELGMLPGKFKAITWKQFKKKGYND